MDYFVNSKLDKISLNVNEGEIVALIGPNGAGKSTALKAVCGLVSPKSGQVLFNGKTINGKQPFQLVKEGLCLVPEGRRVFPTMSVFENIEMGAFTLKTKNGLKENIDRVFHLFPVLKERKKQNQIQVSDLLFFLR